VEFGFRTITTDGREILLNGEPIFLRGFNRHEDSRQRNMCTDLETAERDLREMKRIGANFIRLAHYPHHPGVLDLCDEIGLLVMGEIPLYQKGMNEERVENYDSTVEDAKWQLRRMIERVDNHPSVVFWSVSNETNEGIDDVVDGNNDLVELAREIDPSRLSVHVSNHYQRGDYCFDEDDVICVNAYPSLSQSIEMAERLWEERLTMLREEHPEKPILVTEFGHPSIEGVDDNDVYGEKTQTRAIAEEFSVLREAENVRGAVVWCFADHPWRGDRIIEWEFDARLSVSPFGVVTRDRKHLEAYDRLDELFSNVE